MRMRCANITSLLVLAVATVVEAKEHVLRYTVTEVSVNPDGVYNRTAIGLNNTWPCPNIHITKGDRVELYLTNGLPKENTSLHFHGLFQNGNNAMDGPQFVTQCPIAPGSTYLYNFTVDQQAGTYWYHSHTGSQYLSGLRGAFIVHDSEPEPFDYDEELVLTVSDWYHEDHLTLMSNFLNKYNPTGAEPVPQNILFNDTRNASWHVTPNTTYFLRIASISGFVSQYLWIEEHNFTVVEVDGVYVEQKETNMIYITAGQRYGVLIHTKSEPESLKNYRFMQAFDEEMLDVIPPELELTTANWLVYDISADLPLKLPFDQESASPLNDYELVPYGRPAILPDADYKIELTVEMNNLGNGVNYAFFNNLTYVAPKVPTLATVFSSPEDQLLNSAIYGSNTHSYVIQKDDIVEIVLNNHDDGKHPFHLHGHLFQVVQKSSEFEDEPVDYDEDNHEPFPDYPVLRDTVQVEGNGYAVLRFKATNPGVWLFHCHVDWHLEQGLAITLIEDPVTLKATQNITQNFKDVCAKVGMPYEGNAAGNMVFTNLKGENIQPNWLPPGFTFKGYFAMLLCIVVAFWGLYTIYCFGTDEGEADTEVVANLKMILMHHGMIDEEAE